MKAKISVVIPARESSKTIKRTIKSLREQTIKPYEIIIVASLNDSTKKALRKSKVVKYFEVDCRDEYIRDAQYKRWFGAAKAKGSYIFFTDAKAYLDKNALKLSVELSREYNIGAVAGIAKSWDEDKNLLVSKFQDKALIRNNPKFREISILTKSNFGKTESLPVTTALLVTKRAFNLIKNDFALEYSRYASTYDDYVTAWLLVEKKVNILLTNKVISYHKHRTNWVEYFRQISRSGQSAGLMTRFYPNCPFGKRRKKQVSYFILCQLIISLIILSSLIVSTNAFYLTLFIILVGLIILGIINVLIEKDLDCFIFPPITYMIILAFSFNFVLWCLIDPERNKNYIYKYLQI